VKSWHYEKIIWIDLDRWYCTVGKCLQLYNLQAIYFSSLFNWLTKLCARSFGYDSSICPTPFHIRKLSSISIFVQPARLDDVPKVYPNSAEPKGNGRQTLLWYRSSIPVDVLNNELPKWERLKRILLRNQMARCSQCKNCAFRETVFGPLFNRQIVEAITNDFSYVAPVPISLHPYFYLPKPIYHSSNG